MLAFVTSNKCGNCVSGGYGSATLNMLRQLYGTMHHDSEFPLTLGRDFSGHIVDMGCGVDQNIYRIGDAVSCAKLFVTNSYVVFALLLFLNCCYFRSIWIDKKLQQMLFPIPNCNRDAIILTCRQKVALCKSHYPSDRQKTTFMCTVCVYWWDLS